MYLPHAEDQSFEFQRRKRPHRHPEVGLHGELNVLRFHDNRHWFAGPGRIENGFVIGRQLCRPGPSRQIEQRGEADRSRHSREDCTPADVSTSNGIFSMSAYFENSLSRYLRRRK